MFSITGLFCFFFANSFQNLTLLNFIWNLLVKNPQNEATSVDEYYD